MQLLGLLERMGMGKLSGRDRTCHLYILELALSSPHLYILKDEIGRKKLIRKK
jgi:hypothetical protein